MQMIKKNRDFQLILYLMKKIKSNLKIGSLFLIKKIVLFISQFKGCLLLADMEFDL